MLANNCVTVEAFRYVNFSLFCVRKHAGKNSKEWGVSCRQYKKIEYRKKQRIGECHKEPAKSIFEK